MVTTILDALSAYSGLSYDQAKSLPAGFYTDQAFLDYEIEHLFHKEWLCLGRVEEIPAAGDYFTLDVVGEPLLVVRDQQQAIRIFSNVCRHRGMPVASDKGNTNTFVCPYHAWSYDTQGQLLRTPFIEGRADFPINDCQLPEFNSTVWGGFIFVNLDGRAAPLQPRLVGLEPLLKNYHIDDMTILYNNPEVWNTNWKCLTENFMEGYHLSHVHRETLHPVTPTRLCEHFPPGEGYIGYYSHFPPDLPQRGYYPPDLTEKERNYSVMFAVMPGLVSGAAGHMMSYICLYPRDVDTVYAKQGIAFSDANISAAEQNKVVDLFERTMAEDKEQLGNLQRGMKSKFYQPGPLAPKNFEGTVWDFYQYMARRLV